MTVMIALIISIILQFAAAIIALSLTRRTKTNIAWWLISIAFLLMAFRRVFDLFQLIDKENSFISSLMSTWIGIVISMLMLGSLIFIKRIFDIQKRMDQLRRENETRVLSAIVRTEEKERLNFSKELHDGLGPLLSSVKMAISAIIRKKNSNADHEILQNAEKLVDESIVSLKEISNKLSPHILNNFGLSKAIDSFISKTNTGESPRFEFSSNIEGKRFSYNTEVILYRVICELITNSLKYARCRNIYISLQGGLNNIFLEYFDDGVGFDTEIDQPERSGMGFSNMRSRINSVNGTIEIHSVPDEGMRVRVQIPENILKPVK
jgi:signal transduction histidine kinase